MRLSRDEHILQRAFDRVERDLLLFSKRLFQMRKEIEYLRASLHELAEYNTLVLKGSELDQVGLRPEGNHESGTIRPE